MRGAWRLSSSEVTTLWRSIQIRLLLLLLLLFNLGRSSRGGRQNRNYNSDGQSSERFSPTIAYL